MKVTKATLVNQLAKEMNLSKKEAKRYVDWFVDVLMKSIVAGYEVSLVGFGKLFTKRTHRYIPLTGREHDIVRIVFRPSRKLKNAVK